MAFTKILGPGIHTLANFHSHNINSSGIITATKFVGDMEPGGGTGTFDSLTVTGNLGVGGTVTYTDVTNVDAIGIITAQSGVYIGAGATVGSFNTTTGISSFKKLNVDETSTLNGSVGIADSIIHIDNTDTSIRFPADDRFAVETAGTERLNITAAGKVGIGTITHNNVKAQLHIVEPTEGNSVIQLNSGDTYPNVNRNLTIKSGTGGWAGAKWIFDAVSSGGQLDFQTTSTSRLLITQAGDVGIGTDNPKKTLNVFAGVGTTELIRLSQPVDSSVQQEFGIGWCSNNNHTWPGAQITSQEYDVSDPRRHLLFYTRGLNSDTAPIERLRITYEGDVELYGTGAGITSCKWDASENYLKFEDNSKAVFGSDEDGELWASGSHVYLRAMKSGQTLRLTGDDVYIRNRPDGESMARFDADGGVDLFYNTAPKFETTNTGITVTGEVASSQDYPDIRPTLDFNFAAVKKLDPRFTYTRTGTASYIDEYGILKFVGDNTPRFDHDPDTGECLGLLIEQETSNLLVNTGGTGAPGEQPYAGSSLGNAPTQSIVDDITLPTGKPGSVRRIQFHSGGNTGIRYGWTSGGNANNPYSASVWARAVTGTASATIDVNDQGNNSYTLTTEWTRMKVTGTTGDAYRFMDIMGAASADVYIWGLQLEYNHHVSSYIPSYSSISGTQTAGTRYLDYVSITGDEHSDFWNPEEGTYFITYKPNEPAVGDGVIIGSRKTGNGSGYPWPLYRHDTANTNIFKSYDLATGIVSISSAWEDRRESWALGFNGTNGSIARNGSQLVTNNTSMKGLIDSNELWLGSNGLGSNQYGMYLKRFIYYAKRITDSQLVTLTA